MPLEAPLETGPAIGSAAAVAILVHGRGGAAEDMRQVALLLGRPDIRFVMPRAPVGTWYPKSFLAPLAENEPSLSQSLARYGALVDDLLGRGVAAERLILCGFSQGACLTAQVLLQRPDRYGAALIFTGGFIGPPGTQWPVAPRLAGTPVLVTGSDVDEWVPAGRVRETADVLRGSGAAVTLRLYAGRPHMIAQDEIGAAAGMLREIFGPPPA